MSNVLRDVDARTRLAGSNRLELLLFSLGESRPGTQKEVFGINVFKVREVIRTPPITQVPDAPPFVEGMASLRGEVVSVLNLVDYCGRSSGDEIPQQMIVTEFSRYVQAFLVEGVETIVRVDWGDVKQPPEMLANSKVTAVTQLPDGRLVSILDVEQILHGILGVNMPEHVEDEARLDVIIKPGIKVLCADDTSFARGQIKSALDSIGIPSDIFVNGQEAWDRLESVAQHCAHTGGSVADTYPVVITDIEMPEMDGFLLTKKIKDDPRFEGVKVLIHSSMSGQSNVTKATEMGADGFLAKFSKADICQQLTKLLALG